MPTVPIEIFFIAKTVVDREAVRRWLDFIEAGEFEIPDADTITDPALLIALAGKRCYKSFVADGKLNPNISKIRQDYAAYIDNILASGHGSVLEHAVYSFAIENVSRVFTGEMNRHRAGWAISEGSMRYIRLSDAPYWEPTSIQGDDVVSDDTVARTVDGLCNDPECTFFVPHSRDVVEFKKQLSREVFARAFNVGSKYYRVLQQIWAKELAPDSSFKDKKQITSMMRRIIGMGIATGGVWTGNIRALRHVLTMRCDPTAEEEILMVFSRIMKEIAALEPMIFGDFYQDDNGFWRPKYRKV